MDCSSCKRSNRAGARFCSGCGSPLVPRCPACGAELLVDARFCDSCGAALAGGPGPGSRGDVADSGAARKVVTIVFADLIGSTSLHERIDAESTRRVMERYYAAMRTPVEAHGGTIVQLLGDGVMCAFGVPHVAEDDAIRAVRAAVGMQQAFREFLRDEGEIVAGLGLRVAVNTGEVVVSDERPQGIGDPLNVAGRLQQEAREGDVLIGEATQRLVGEQVTLAHFGTLALRGRAEPVPAYRVVSLERPAGAPAIAFVGREEELRRLTSVYDAAVAAPGARLAAILGSPGLGKSRLLAELARRLGGRASVLTARCDSAGGATFAPLADALRTFLELDTGADIDAVRAAVEDVLPADDAERGRIAKGVAALVAGTPASPEETFFVVRRLLAALAASQPVVLALDDLQWAEPLLLDLTEHLVQWSSGVPLLVLVAARPELRDSRSSLAAPGGFVTDVVTLAGLDASAATRLAANVIGADELPAAIAGRVLAASEGNPLFVGELVRMLVHDGALKREGDRWTTSVALADLEMPPTIQALLAARIERLRPEERTILERAAVVGRHFSRAAVAQLLPREIGDLDARLESLRRSELIEPDTGWFLGEPALRFHHALIRDAAYRRVLRGTRAGLHERFADWVVSRVGDSVEHDETIGWHLEQAHQQLRELGPVDGRGQELGQRAAKYLAAAGRRALARDDLPVAANLLGRALDRLDAADPARAELTLDRCESLLAAGDVAPAAAAIAELERFASDSDRMRAWHTCFAGQLAALTDPQSLRATAAAVAAAAQSLAAAGDTAGEAKAHSVHALALQRLGKVGACEAALDLALAAARRVGDRRRSNAVLAGAPLAALWGPSPVTRASGRCLDVVRVLRITQGAPAVEAVALRCQAVLEALRGRADAARRMLASSRRMVEELGLTPQLLETDVFSGVIDLLEGDAAAAERSLRGAYDGLREHGLGIDAARAAALLARALFAQGRAVEAEALSRESESLAGDDLHAAIAWRGARAEALARRGEHAQAVEFARAAVEIAAATDALLDHADARSALATALRAAGRNAEADTEERRAIELWEAKGATLPAERARRSLRAPAAVSPSRSEAPPPATRVRPKVRANAATGFVTRLDAVVLARDAAALSRLFADFAEIVHHPTATKFGREGGLARFSSLLRSDETKCRHEPLATLGDSFALCHLRTSVSSLGDDDVAPFGAIDADEIILLEVDARGQGTRAEIFASDQLADSIARLYERYAESLPDGPERARAAATARVVSVLMAAPALDPYGTAFAEDVAWVDHRTLGFGSLRGRDALLRAFRSLFATSADLAVRVEDVLALGSGALLVRWTISGTDRAEGGAFERQFLLAWAFGGDGLVIRSEQFDAGREAEALGRLDAIAVPSITVRVTRPVRPNAATANAARMDAAVAARDLDAFQSLLREDAQGVHHPTGMRYEESRSRENYRAVFGSEGAALRHVPLASLGDSHALFRTSLSVREGTEESVIPSHGAFDSDSFLVTEVDTVGLRRFSEFFATDRLGEAVTRLYELHAESLPQGAARVRAASIASSVARLLGPPDLAHWGSAFSPAIEWLDHRTVGLGPVHGAEAVLRAIGALFQLLEFTRTQVDEILDLRADSVVLRWTNLGTDRAGGGSVERNVCLLWMFGADGLLARWEQFEPGAAHQALARADELGAESRKVARRVRPNAATAHATRLEAAAAARDFAAFKSQFADGAQVVHHPTGTTFDESRNFPDLEWLLQAPTFEFEHRPVATLGDSLALCRASMSFSSLQSTDFDLGASVNDWFLLIEVDASGRRRRSELFANDRLGNAIVRLYERYAESLPDGPTRERAAATARSIGTLVPVGASSDPSRMRAAVSEDVAHVDHRRTVGLGEQRGFEAFLRANEALRALSSDFRLRIDDALDLRSNLSLVRVTTSGTDRASGGAFERAFLLLLAFGSDGLVSRWEQFDVDRDGEALARFDELTAESRKPRLARRVRPNAATANAARLDAAAAARDFAALKDQFADGAQVVHHPTGTTFEESRNLPDLERLLQVPVFEFENRPIATLGDSLALLRASTSFSGAVEGTGFDFGEVANEWLLLTEVDAAGRRRHSEFFAVDRLGDAIVRLYERYAELQPEGAARDAAANVARSMRAMLEAPDIELLSQSFAPDIELVDKRTLGTWSARGREAALDQFRSLLEVAGGITMRQYEILRVEVRTSLVRRTHFGTDRVSGGSYERCFIMLLVCGADGLLTRMEWFDADSEVEALARFDEIVAESQIPAPRRARPNAATANAARMDAAVAARDLDAFLALFADDAQAVHHPTGAAYAERESRRAYELMLRTNDLVFAHEPLATLGESLALCFGKTSFSGVTEAEFGDYGATNMDSFIVMETGARGVRKHTEFFAVDRLADALVRLYQRYADLQPEGTARSAAAAVARSTRAMFEAPDPVRLARAFAPDVELVDRSSLGTWSARGAEAALRQFRSLLEVAGRIEMRDYEILRVEPRASLVRRTHCGTDRVNGGAYETRLLLLMTFGSDGLLTRVEWFDADREAEALARFDSLTAESPRSKRRVRPNAATANATRLEAALAARDESAFPAVFAQSAESVHHPTGAVYDRSGVLSSLRLLLDARDLSFRYEPLATLGESLALCRVHLSHDPIVSAAERGLVVLIEVDARGARTRGEFFAPDALAAAIVRLYERYAELLPDGPARERARVTADTAAALSFPFDAERYSRALSRDAAFVDHRALGLGTEGLPRWLGTLHETADDLAMSVDDVLALRPDSLLVDTSSTGTLRAGGGVFEQANVQLFVVGADGRVARVEWFEPSQIDEALARLDVLTAESPASRFANTASRTMETFEHAWRERDWDRVTATFVETHQMDDRRPLMRMQVSGEEFLANERMLFQETASEWHGELLATRGERLALLRMRFAAEVEGSGPMAVEMLDLVEVDFAGRRAALVVFDLDDLDAAHAELDRRYVAGEGAPWAELIEHQRALTRAAGSADQAELGRLLPADFSVVNHQRFGGTGERRNKDQYIDNIRALDDLGVRGSLRLDHLPRISATAALAATTWYGTRDDGEFETSQCVVCAHDGRRFHSWEIFDPDQFDRALARYEELTRARVTPRVENLATRAMARGREALEAGDWEQFTAQFRSDFRNSDRRRMVLLELDRAQYLESLRANFTMHERATFDPFATRGTRLAMIRFRWTMSDDSVGPSEGDFLMLAEVDDAGRVMALVFFDSDSLDAAYAELDLRYAAGEAAPHRDTWEIFQRRLQAHGSHDWEALAALSRPDLVTEDHRPVRWGTLRTRDEYVAMVRGLVELAPDARLRLEHVLALDERNLLTIVRWVGNRDGGPFEIPVVNVTELDAGDVRVLHAFDLEQLEEARACYAALRRSSSTAHIENGATQSLERLTRAWATRDWNGVAATLGPGFRQLDRRPMMQLELDRDEFLAFMREVYDMSSSRLESEVIATRGSRLALARVRFQGADDVIGPTEIESLAVIEVGEHGTRSAMIRFETDALDAAFAELDARYGASDPEFAQLKSFTARTDERDWDAVAAFMAPDFVMHDHRPLGWETLHGGHAWIDTMRALVELAPDVRLRIDHFSRAGRVSLIVSTWVGTREGGAFEDQKLTVSERDEDGRFRRIDQYDLGQLDRARARFEELRPDPLRIPPNSALRVSDDLHQARDARDWDAFAELCAPALQFDDRRRSMLATGDRDAFIANSEWIAAQGIRVTRTLLATAGDRLVLEHQHWWKGTIDAPESELESLAITEIDPEGRAAAVIIFDADDRGAASNEMRSRFVHDRGMRVPPNAATRALDRVHEAFEARDWSALEARCSPALVWNDQRPRARFDGDRRMFMASARLIASQGSRLQRTLVATAGDRLALEYQRWAGATVAPDLEIQLLTVQEADAEGRMSAAIAFEPEDRRAAALEMFERYARSEAASSVPAATFEAIRAMNAHDLGRLRAALPSDFVLHDHRRTGLGRIEGAEAFIESLAAVLAESQDWTVETLYILANEPHGELAMARAFGALASGGEFESVYLRLIAHGRSMELFEPDDLERARARFEELRPSRTEEIEK